MSNKHRPTYDSQRNRDNYTFHPGRTFHLTWETDPGTCCLYPLSDRQAAMLRKMLQVFPKYHWVWGLPSPRDDWDVPTQQIWEEISTFCEETEACLVSDCDLTEFNTNLDRIATALESIEQNQAIRYTVQDLIDDLEDTFGVGHILYDLVSAFLGLFPRFKVKVDATPLAVGLWETWTRWMPLNASLATIAASTTAIAAATATGKVMDLINLALSGLDYVTKVGAGWRDFMLGEGTTFWDLISQIRQIFIPADDGGTGGDDPDNDPALRTVVNVQARNEVQNFITACCAGYPNLPQPDGTGVSAVEQSGDVGDAISPENTTQITWGSARTDSEKCQASRAIVQWAIDIFERLDDSLPSAPLSPADIMGLVLAIAATAVFAPPIALVAFIGLASTLAGLSLTGALGQAVASIRQTLFDHSEDIVCAIFDASSVESARNQIEIILQNAGLSSVLTPVVMYVFSPTVLSAAFYGAPGMDVSSFSSDCTGCATSCPDYIISNGVEIAPYEFQSVLSTWHRVDILLNTDHSNNVGPWCGPELTFTILTNGQSQSTNPLSDFRVWQDNDAPFTSSNPTEYNSDTHPGATVLTGRWLAITSNTPFTVEIVPQ